MDLYPEFCTETHVGYTILSALMLFLGGMVGFSIPLERFYALDTAYTKLEREKNAEIKELRTQLRTNRMGAELSMRLLRDIRSSSEDTDSSGTDV